MVGGPGACASAPGISQQAMAAACDERLQEEKMRCFTLTGDYRQAITPAGNVELFGALEVAQHIVRNYAQDVRGELLGAVVGVGVHAQPIRRQASARALWARMCATLASKLRRARRSSAPPSSLGKRRP